MIQVAKADLKVKRKIKNVHSSHTIVNQQEPSESGNNDSLYDELSTMKQKLFEKNCRIQFLEKQSLKDKAELDAKDRLIDSEVAR